MATPTDIGNVFSDCPGRAVLDHVASRWGVLILSALREEDLRFHQLRDRIDGISEKILGQNLRMLARDGLVQRTVYPASPPQVSYALTDLGRSLGTPLSSLLDWISEHTAQIVDAQRRHDEGFGGDGSDSNSRRV